MMSLSEGTLAIVSETGLGIGCATALKLLEFLNYGVASDTDGGSIELLMGNANPVVDALSGCPSQVSDEQLANYINAHRDELLGEVDLSVIQGEVFNTEVTLQASGRHSTSAAALGGWTGSMRPSPK